jgi:O-antigen/teichoic acid export membrane protein
MTDPSSLTMRLEPGPAFTGNLAGDQAAPPAGLRFQGISTNFAWTLPGNVAYAGSQWAIWMILARFGGAVLVGQYALAQAIAVPVVFFSNLQLRALQATDRSQRVPFGEYLALRIASTGLAFAAVLGIAAFSSRARAEFAVIALVALSRCTESMSDVYFGHLQAIERMDRIAKSQLMKSGASMAITTLVLYTTHSLALALAGLNAAWLAVYAVYDSKIARLPLNKRKPIWDRRRLLKLARYAFPLGVTMLVIQLNISAPRYFVLHYGGLRELGLFSILASVQTAGSVISTALGQAATPKLADAYAAGDGPRLARIAGKLLLFSLGLGGVIVASVGLAGDWIVTKLYGQQYGGHNAALLVMATVALVSYLSSMLGFTATAARRIAFQSYAACTVAATTAGCCWLLARSDSLMGAALSMGAGAAVGLALYAGNVLLALREIRNGGSRDWPIL